MSALIRTAAFASALVLSVAAVPAAAAGSSGSASTSGTTGTLSSGSLGSSGGDGDGGSGSSGSLGSLGSSGWGGPTGPNDPGDPGDPGNPADGACVATPDDALGDGADGGDHDPGNPPTGSVIAMISFDGGHGGAYVEPGDTVLMSATVTSPASGSVVDAFTVHAPVPDNFTYVTDSAESAMGDVNATPDAGGLNITFSDGAQQIGTVTAQYTFDGPAPAVPSRLWPDTDPAWSNIMVDPDGNGPQPAAVVTNYSDLGIYGYNVTSTDSPESDSSVLYGNAWVEGRSEGALTAGDCVLYRGFSMATSTLGEDLTIDFALDDDPDAPFALDPDPNNTEGIIIEGLEDVEHTVTREEGLVRVTYPWWVDTDPRFVVVTVGGQALPGRSGQTIEPKWQHSTDPTEWTRNYWPARHPELWKYYQPTGTGEPVTIG
ncbi:hypothetical protein [Dietzia sp. 179-F 9C3 NHS]|uniref:hypothetical protein n=1 Tax=Dietzia sp. 179-F 9C3 NHS TaxID=3374295 RepID=UPI003879B33C